MKRFLSFACLAFLSISAGAATLNPIQLLNPSGSQPGDSIVSTGASTAPAWSSGVGAPQYNAMAYGAKCDGTTNDAPAIQSAINAAQIAKGGVVNLPAGKTCAISSTLAITASNVGMYGPSGGFSPNDSPFSGLPVSGSSLKWIGSSGGTMVSIIAPTGSTSNLPLMGNSVVGIGFDGNNGLAANGLMLKTVDSGRYQNLTFVNFNGGSSLTLGTVQPTSTNFSPSATADSQLNVFDGIFIQSLNNGATGGSNGFTLDGYAGGGGLTVNASENTFNNMSIYVGLGATGIYCNGCDTNHFTSVSIGNLGGSAPSIDLSIRVDGANSYPANSNVFDGLVTGNAIRARGQTTFSFCTSGFTVPAGSCTSANYINGLDADNGTPTPIVEPGAQLLWRMVNGFSANQVFGPIAMAPAQSQALSASSKMTTETLRIVNSANNHVVLSDATGTNTWGMDMDGSQNLRFTALAGTSGTVFFPTAIQSTSAITGSIVTYGGVGIGQNLTVGGTLATTGAATITGGTTSSSYSLSSLVSSTNAPTIASGFGTSPSITSSNGTAAFQIHIGTGGTVATGTVTMPAAAHGWACDAQDISTVSAGVYQTKQISTTTTAVGFQNYNTSAVPTAWAAGDNLVIKCSAF